MGKTRKTAEAVFFVYTLLLVKEMNKKDYT